MDKIMERLGLKPLAEPAAETEKAPELVGKTYAEAKQIAQSKSLTLTPDPPNAGDDWKVIEQTPMAQDPMPGDRKITVRLEEKAPELKGKTYAEAKQIAQSKSLTLTPDPTHAEDDWKVIEQTPKAPDPMPGDRKITVKLEEKQDKPPETEETVPMLKDLDFAMAKERASSKKLTLKRDPQNAADHWFVKDQDPDPGKPVPESREVGVELVERVPNLYTLKKDAAETEARVKGFNLTMKTVGGDDSIPDDYVVLSQNPDVGDDAPDDRIIELTFGPDRALGNVEIVGRILNVVPSPRQDDDLSIADALEAGILAEPLAETVPPLVGLTREDAKRIATRKGFKVRTSPSECGTTPDWCVEDQEPGADSLAPEDREITIFLRPPMVVTDDNELPD
jgi:beta-lactam-binding protein with PASTA domain